MCSEHLKLWKGLFKLEFRGIEQDLILSVGQLRFPNVPVEGRIIDLDIHGLLDGPCNVVRLPTHNEEVFHPGRMTCGVSMVTNGGGGLRYFLSLFPKVLADSSMYFSSHPSLSHLYLYTTPPFCVMLSLFFWATRRIFVFETIA